MDIFLAIVVALAVVFFGALISMGNERQRRAIDSLREQIVLWAVQDLKMKQGQLERTVDVPDPLLWLNKVTTNLCGHDPKLQGPESFEEPPTLVCTTGDGKSKFVFSPISPTELRRIKKARSGRLSLFSGHNPLLFLPKSAAVWEVSLLNAGHLFDLELNLTWKALTGLDLDLSGRIWVYEYLYH